MRDLTPEEEAEKLRIAQEVERRGSTIAGLVELARSQTEQIGELGTLVHAEATAAAELRVSIETEQAARKEDTRSRNRMTMVLIILTVISALSAVGAVTASVFSYTQSKDNGQTLELVKSTVTPGGDINAKNAANQSAAINGLVITIGKEVDARTCQRVEEALTAAGISYDGHCPVAPSVLLQQQTTTTTTTGP